MPDREIPERGVLFWDGVAWGLRLFLAIVHLLFALPVLFRWNIPLLFKGYEKFDDVMPFTNWGWLSLGAVLLLLLVPTRVPWGLVTTLYSMTLFFAIGATFALGAGLLPGTTLFFGFALGAAALFGRSMWLYAIRVRWFQQHVLDRGVRNG